MAVQTASAPQLFSASYSLARQRLLQAADARSLSVETHPHPLPGVHGEALALDVVRDGPIDARKGLLLTSAVHGLEDHCGSGVQLGRHPRRTEGQKFKAPLR